MRSLECDLLIIGGGLSGLALAYFLRKSALSLMIVEARDRLGGRVLTKYKEGSAPIELGATWLGPKHASLIRLIQELGLGVFEQERGSHAIYETAVGRSAQLVDLPSSMEASYRFVGGTSLLINKLASLLEPSQIVAAETINVVEEAGLFLKAIGNKCAFKSKFIVSTLPPHLLQKTIVFSPSLPKELTRLAQETHTWMGESIKVGLRYKIPFWRTAKSIGTIFSNVGPIQEMYDHSDFDDKVFAIKGFVNPALFQLSEDERKRRVLQQLEKYYGEIVHNYLGYEEKVWRQDSLTYREYDTPVAGHQNNGHALYRQPFLNNKFYLGGSETAEHFPGYMDGAVESAKRIAEILKHKIS